MLLLEADALPINDSNILHNSKKVSDSDTRWAARAGEFHHLLRWRGEVMRWNAAEIFHTKMCQASFLTSALRCWISLTWGLFSHSSTSTLLTVLRCYWAHAPKVSEPLHVCNEQCNSYKFLFLSCSDVWHFFCFCCCYRIIFLPSPPFSLSPMSLSGLKGIFDDSTGPPVTHWNSLIIWNVAEHFCLIMGHYLMPLIQLFCIFALLNIC